MAPLLGSLGSHCQTTHLALKLITHLPAVSHRVGCGNFLGNLLTLLLRNVGAFLVVSGPRTDILVHSGALLLVGGLLAALNADPALRVLDCGAELPVGRLVVRLALDSGNSSKGNIINSLALVP